MTMLRQVLQAFEISDRPLTLTQLARQLDLAPGMLDGMIDYWVRKGKLRALHTQNACTSCGSASGCPFIVRLPPMYELVTGDSPAGSNPPCACCK